MNILLVSVKTWQKKIPKVSGICCDYIKGNYPNTVFLNPVNKTKILDIIHGLQPNKVAGHDDCSPRVIKAVAYIIADPLASVFNISISTASVFPQQLKIAKVTPVFLFLKQTTNYW